MAAESPGGKYLRAAGNLRPGQNHQLGDVPGRCRVWVELTAGPEGMAVVRKTLVHAEDDLRVTSSHRLPQPGQGDRNAFCVRGSRQPVCRLTRSRLNRRRRPAAKQWRALVSLRLALEPASHNMQAGRSGAAFARGRGGGT
jgi:hypothetical protein